MNSPELIQQLLDHNYWARDLQLGACAGLTQEQFLRPMGNSYASLRDTLAHLVAVEWLWLERWRGRSNPALEPADVFPTLAAVSERWKVVEREMRAHFANLDAEALAKPLSYFNLKGESCSYSLETMILHALTHQAYHRGQVTMILRLLGVKPPTVDFLRGYDLEFQR